MPNFCQAGGGSFVVGLFENNKPVSPEFEALDLTILHLEGSEPTQTRVDFERTSFGTKVVESSFARSICGSRTTD